MPAAESFVRAAASASLQETCRNRGDWPVDEMVAPAYRASASDSAECVTHLFGFHSHDVSVDAIRDWEQGRRSPRGAARTLLRVAMQHPEVLRRLDRRT